MFTGIIEEKGTIKQIQPVSEQSIQMIIKAEKILEDVNLGDSISVNGICLTVTQFTANEFQVDVMPETVKSTSLHGLTSGAHVNLERAMAANGRFGGHFVSGHVDGVGTIKRKQKQENAVYYDIEIPEEFARFVLLKGSITVDGTSLTVFNSKDNTFTISLIPHTVSETVLGEKGQGDIVNIECDMLAKYVQNMLEQQFSSQKEDISKDFLRNNGFL
ncbi:riboflavin synthase alpha chain [Oceanobacillus limi]|uniref:Riboflavin synthase n=1 Tax=Oceanobacillus limi TaxID=930131 RepID=A0A1I0E0D0_9BACI|nr:riboflavin synthase [Oceanobacillus limi]SET38492.1 riboflavin synthase alpha chain [Oceanobacillus limi]